MYSAECASKVMLFSPSIYAVYGNVYEELG